MESLGSDANTGEISGNKAQLGAHILSIYEQAARILPSNTYLQPFTAPAIELSQAGSGDNVGPAPTELA